MAELFDVFPYLKNDKITIGYRINELYWNKGIATNIIQLLVQYLSQEIRICRR